MSESLPFGPRQGTYVHNRHRCTATLGGIKLRFVKHTSILTSTPFVFKPIFSRGSGQLRPRCVLRRRVLPACLRLTDVEKKLEGIMCADPAYAPTGPTRIREFRMKKRLMRPLHGRKMLGAHIQYSIMNLLFESSNACLAYRRSIKPSPAPFPSSNPPSSPHQLH